MSDRGRLPASVLAAYQAATTTLAAVKPPAKTKSSTASPSTKRPSAGGRNKAAVAAAVQGKTAPTGSRELFGDQQSVLRRLTFLEGQVAELLGRLEAAARALDPANNKRT